jgi:hypothetical protein
VLFRVAFGRLVVIYSAVRGEPKFTLHFARHFFLSPPTLPHSLVQRALDYTLLWQSGDRDLRPPCQLCLKN